MGREAAFILCVPAVNPIYVTGVVYTLENGLALNRYLEGKSRTNFALEKCKQSPAREFSIPLKLEI